MHAFIAHLLILTLFTSTSTVVTFLIDFGVSTRRFLTKAEHHVDFSMNPRFLLVSITNHKVVALLGLITIWILY